MDSEKNNFKCDTLNDGNLEIIGCEPTQQSDEKGHKSSDQSANLLVNNSGSKGDIDNRSLKREGRTSNLILTVR